MRRPGKETVEVKQDEAQYFEAPTEREGETRSELEPRQPMPSVPNPPSTHS
jgi:hypothetical protein